MHIFKKAAIRITALLLFAAIIASVILWQTGVYDISFIKRAPKPETDETTAEETLPEDTAPEETDNKGENEPVIEPVTEVSEEEAAELLDKILPLSEMKKSGYKVSAKEFDNLSTVARTTPSFMKFDSLSYHTQKVSKQQMIKDSSTGLYKKKTVTETENIPVVRLYFGYQIVDVGNAYYLYNSSGKLLDKNFKGTLVYAKSESGKPVVQVKNKYYELDQLKGLGKTILEDEIDWKPLKFDYPEYYGNSGSVDLYPFLATIDVYTEIEGETVPDTETTASETEAQTVTETEKQTTTPIETAPPETKPSEPKTTESQAPETAPETQQIPVEIDHIEAQAPADAVIIDGKYYTVSQVEAWGYRNKAGEEVIAPQYSMAYPFSSCGLAAVTDSEGRLMYIDTSGNVVISLIPEEEIKAESLNNIRARQSYREAVSDGIESIGMYCFDHDYVMIRRILTGYSLTYNIYENGNELFGKTGNKFVVPNGYTLINYSDGVLLLEKNGKYGYMNLAGSWVQPASYKSASPFVQGLAVVCSDNGKYGMINTKGEYVLPMCFDYISNASSGYIATYSQSRSWEVYAVVSK